jgi:hypothetical protein
MCPVLVSLSAAHHGLLCVDQRQLKTKVVFHWLRLHWVVLLQVTTLNKESPPGVGSRVAQVCLQVSRFTYPFW